MGTRALSALSIAVGVVAAAPALAWLVTPAASLGGIAVGAFAVLAALHGLGRLVGRAIGDDDAPAPLAIAWGLAAYLGLGGLLAGPGVFGSTAQALVGVIASVAGAGWLAFRILRVPRPVWPSAGALALALPALALVVFHLVGAAAAWTGLFSDGEAYLLGPLARLGETGALPDAVGFPRAIGAGGTVVLGSLTAPFGDPRLLHVIDRGLGLGLVVWLILAGGRGGTGRGLLAFSILVLVSAAPELGDDVGPRWTVVALVLALRDTLARGRARVDVRAVAAPVLIAAAIASLRHGGLGLLAVVIVLVTVRGHGARGRRLALAAVLVVLVLGGYALAAIAAHIELPGADGPMWFPGLIARLVGGALGALVLHALLALALRDRDDPILAAMMTALCAALAIGLALAPAVLLGAALTPFAFAAILLLLAPALELDPAATSPPPLAVAAIVLLALGLATVRFPVGRPPLGWHQRLVRMVDDVRAFTAGAASEHTERADIARALAAVPPGARVGLWLGRPDLVTYAGRDVVDLRSVVATACTDLLARRSKVRRWPRPCRELERRLPRLALGYLLVDRGALSRARTGFALAWCRALDPAACLDPVAAFAGLEHLPDGEAIVVVPLAGTARTTRP